jgi:hypothetical protein
MNVARLFVALRCGAYDTLDVTEYERRRGLSVAPWRDCIRRSAASISMFASLFAFTPGVDSRIVRGPMQKRRGVATGRS